MFFDYVENLQNQSESIKVHQNSAIPFVLAVSQLETKKRPAPADLWELRLNIETFHLIPWHHKRSIFHLWIRFW